MYGRTQSGTFMDGDLLVNRDGVRIVSHSDVEVVRFQIVFGYFHPNLFTVSEKTERGKKK